MATTDNCVQYDQRFWTEYQHLFLNEFGQEEMDGAILKMVNLGLLQRERFVEIAITRQNPNLKLDSKQHQDFNDKSDLKTVVEGDRNNTKTKVVNGKVKKGTWMSSFAISNVHKKIGALRIVAYNKKLDKFHYFFIPHSAYRHITTVLEIVIETKTTEETSSPKSFTGQPQTHRKWWEFECSSFAEMCEKM